LYPKADCEQLVGFPEVNYVNLHHSLSCFQIKRIKELLNKEKDVLLGLKTNLCFEELDWVPP